MYVNLPDSPEGFDVLRRFFNIQSSTYRKKKAVQMLFIHWFRHNRKEQQNMILGYRIYRKKKAVQILFIH